jgi:hypothetical protein
MTKPATALQRKPKKSNIRLEPDALNLQSLESIAAELKARTEEAVANAVLGRVEAIEATEKKSFSEKGILILAVKKHDLWAKASTPFASFNAWMGSKGDDCRASRFASMRAVDHANGKGLSAEECEKMPRFSMSMIPKLPKAYLDKPETREALRTMDENSLVEKVQRECPEAHIEHNGFWKLKPTESQRQIYLRVINRAMERFDLSSREDALEAVLIEIDQTWDKEDWDRDEAKGKGASA